MLQLIRHLLPLVLLPLCVAACGKSAGSVPPGTTLEMRLEFDPATDDLSVAEEFEYRGERVRLGPAREYELASLSQSRDRLGLPAIGFELRREDALRFKRWTGESVGKRLAILVDGEVVICPTIQSALPGGGIIRGGGADGFSVEECSELMAAILE